MDQGISLDYPKLEISTASKHCYLELWSVKTDKASGNLEPIYINLLKHNLVDLDELVHQSINLKRLKTIYDNQHD